MLLENPQIKIEENLNNVTELKEEPEAGAEVKIWCTVISTIERLDDELFKSLQVLSNNNMTWQ